MFHTRSASRSTSVIAISFVLVAAFLVATPLGQTADARKCGPRQCHPRIYCDDAGVSIEGTDAAETIFGTDGADIILAKGGVDIVYGGGGDDIICGGEGNDIIYGGDGSDIIYPNKGKDIVDGGAGEDAISYNDDTSDLLAATVTPFQFGTNLTNFTFFTARKGRGMTVSFAVVVDLSSPGVCGNRANTETGSRAVSGCAANDGYGNQDLILADPVSGEGSIEDITGSRFPIAASSQPLVNGQLLRNYLIGDAQDNVISGSGGADVMFGGTGEDMVDYWGDGAVSVTLVTPCPGIPAYGCGIDGGGQGDWLSDIEDVNGTRYNDQITGDYKANVLDGGSTYFSTYNGDDQISGNGGDDILLGGTGTNVLDGGDGIDLADYSNEPGLGGVSINLAVVGPKAPGFSTDTLPSIEGLIGTSAPDTLIGNQFANVLLGEGGNDTLAGGAGVDTLAGGAGVDTVDYSDDPGPVALNLAFDTASDGGGSDESVTEFENVVGSAFDDTLIDEHGIVNVLDGGPGTADTCYARPGDPDQAVNCETTPTIIPVTPTNLSTDQTGDAPVLHGSFSVVDGGTGTVVYTVWDANPDTSPTVNVIVPPTSGTMVNLGGHGQNNPTDSRLSLAGVPLVDGQTYYWKAAANDGVGDSPQSTVQAFVAQSKPAGAFPGFTWNHYITDLPTVSTAVWGSRGGNEATRQAAGNDPGKAEVILDFGYPRKSGTTFGTYSLYQLNPSLANNFLPLATIKSWVKAYADGWYSASGANSIHLNLIVAVNSSNATWLDAGNGGEWARMVNQIGDYLGSSPACGGCDETRKIVVTGGGDFETGWANPTPTLKWLQGYRDTTSHHFFNFGDAGGCPEHTHNDGPCNKNWTQADVLDASWVPTGTRVFPLPEIYDNVRTLDDVCDKADDHTCEWFEIDLYSIYKTDRGRVDFRGVTTESKACGCSSENTPREGWQHLQDAVNSQANTTIDIEWAGDMDWNFT